MTCVHLKALYQLCQEHDLRFSGSDLVRITCKECDAEEVCPSVLTDEYDAAERQHGGETGDKRGDP